MMQRLKSIDLKFSIRIDLFAFAIVMIFFTMVSPVEEIEDIEHYGGYLYLAVGKHGIQVIDINTNPGVPREVGVYNTSGTAQALSIGNMQGQMMLYVAIGNKGIEAYKILDGGKLEYQWSDRSLSKAEDIAIHGKFGFIARGKNGFVLAKIDEKPPPSSDRKIYTWPLNEVEQKSAGAESVEDVGETVENGDSQKIILGNINRVIVSKDKAYLVDSDFKLHVLFVESPKEPVHLGYHELGFPVNDIWIENNLAYVATNGSGLLVLDLEHPEAIEEIASYKDINNIKSISVYGGFAFISGGSQGIEILEITNPKQEIIKIGGKNKFKIGELDLQSIKSNPENYSPDPIEDPMDASKIIRVGSYIYFSDGLKGLRALQYEQKIHVENPDSLGGLGEEQGWSEDMVVIRNPQNKDGNERFVYIVGRRRGLWILDVTNPSSPKDVTPEIDNRGWATSIAARGDYVYVGYAESGLSIYSVSNPSNPELITHLKMDQRIEDIGVIDDNHIILVTGETGLQVINISDLPNIHIIGQVDTPGNAIGVFIQADHAYVADGKGGLQVVNISDRQKPTIVGSGDLDSDTMSVTVYEFQDSDNSNHLYAFVAHGSGGFSIFDVSIPQEPLFLKNIGTAEFVQDVAIEGQVLFVAEREEGLLRFSLEDPKAPVQDGVIDTPGQAAALSVDENIVYIADYDRGLRIIQADKGKPLAVLGYFDMPTTVTDLVISDNEFGYLVDKEGIWAVSLESHKNPIPMDLLKTELPPNSIALGPIIMVKKENGKENIKKDKTEPESGSDELEAGRYAYFTIKGKVNREDPDSEIINQLKLIDITTDILSPEILASYDDLKDVRMVNIRDNYAYIADGYAGVKILVISDTKKIERVGEFNTQGIATNVEFSGNYMYVTTSDGKLEIANILDPINPSRVTPITSMLDILTNPINVTLDPQSEYAYVSDGENGLFVFDVNRPYDPKMIFPWNTQGQLNDVAVIQHYAFLSDGGGGVDLLYTPEAGEFYTDTDWYYLMNDNTDIGVDDGCKAVSIDVIPHIIKDDTKNNDDDYDYAYQKRNLHHYAYVATEKCGLMTLDYQVNMDLSGDGFTTSPGDATLGMVTRSYGKLIKDSILLIWQKSGDDDIGFDKILNLAWLTFSAKYAALDQRIKDTTQLYGFGVFMFSIGIFYWLALIAHFVLPVRQTQDAWRSFGRLFRFFRGTHGPIITAKEGKENIVPLEDQKPGVALVDLNSSIVVEEYPVSKWMPRIGQQRLQKRRLNTGESILQAKAEGPGIVFLKPYERLRGTVDLRRQIRVRLGVKGLTRDRIEVKTVIFTLFSLGEPPDIKLVTYVGSEDPENIRVIELKDEKIPIPGNPDRLHTVEKVRELIDVLDAEEKYEIHRYVQAYKVGQAESNLPGSGRTLRQGQKGPYLFDEQRVFNAIVSKPYDVQDQEIKEWTELPPHVAVAEFRNMLSQEMYDHLFETQEPKKYPIIELKRNFARRIQYMGVMAYQYVEERVGRQIKEEQIWDKSNFLFSPVRNLKTPKPLRSRGIKIVTANFTELQPTHRDVATHLTNYWQSEWEKETTMLEADMQFQASRLKSLARVQSQNDLVNTLGMILNETPLSREALVLRIFQALETAAAAPETRRILPSDAIQMLREIHSLLIPGDGMQIMGGVGFPASIQPPLGDSEDSDSPEDANEDDQ